MWTGRVYRVLDRRSLANLPEEYQPAVAALTRRGRRGPELHVDGSMSEQAETTFETIMKEWLGITRENVDLVTPPPAVAGAGGTGAGVVAAGGTGAGASAGANAGAGVGAGAGAGDAGMDPDAGENGLLDDDVEAELEERRLDAIATGNAQPDEMSTVHAYQTQSKKRKQRRQKAPGVAKVGRCADCQATPNFTPSARRCC